MPSFFSPSVQHMVITPILYLSFPPPTCQLLDSQQSSEENKVGNRNEETYSGRKNMLLLVK